MKSNNILRETIIISSVLVIAIYIMYPAYKWPIGTEALGCLVSEILLITTAIFLRTTENEEFDDIRKRNVTLGLYFGVLWTIEIGINNLIQPGLPYRDIIDNIFWAIIALLILLTAARDAYKSKKFLSGVKAGFWSGLASGAIACLTAMILIVFGMKFIIADPLNLKEWSNIKNNSDSPGMAIYFAYQTLAGAVMHLFILGAIMGLVLGSLGGIAGKTIRKV